MNYTFEKIRHNWSHNRHLINHTNPREAKHENGLQTSIQSL